MRSLTTTWRRAAATALLVAALAGALVVAERGSAPVRDINSRSIALSLPALPKFPTSPKLTTSSPLLQGNQPSASQVSPSFVPGGGPVNQAVCAALFVERAALLAAPPSPAVDTALTLNAIRLAIFHCVPISGDFHHPLPPF